MQERTTLPVRKATRDRLRVFGRKGESYDDILRRLVEIAEKSAFVERQLGVFEGVPILFPQRNLRYFSPTKRCHSCGLWRLASAIESWTTCGNSRRSHSTCVLGPTSRTAGGTTARRSTG